MATLTVVIVINFLLFRALPGDPSALLLQGSRGSVTRAQIDAQRERWGLDRPLIPDQLIAYVTSTIQGDLGYSFKYRGRPVADVVGERLLPTLLLLGLAQGIAISVGVAIGAVAGWRRGSRFDKVATGVSIVLYATPYFWLGMILIILFAGSIHLLPSQGMITPARTGGGILATVMDVVSHLILPLTTLTLGFVAQYILVTKSAVTSVRTEDYIQTARAKGLPSDRILARHALPNAILPVIAVASVNIGYIVVGAITVEAVFSWPGIGSLTVEALSGRDYPVMQAIFLLLGVSVVLANLLAEIAYGLLDPRVEQ